MSLELHPLCTLFPRMAGAEFDALCEDIRTNGLRSPIVLHEGMILDGGNRWAACKAVGIEPKFSRFDGTNLVAFVLSANLHRRHMTAGQQAAIVASAQDWGLAQERGGDRGNQHGGPRQSATLHFASVETRAAESGASVRTQKMADKVAKADPDLARQVAHGTISLPKAERIVSGDGKPKKLKSRPPEVVPEDVSPSELDQLHEQIRELNRNLQEALDDNRRMGVIFDADDRLAKALSENKRLAAESILYRQRMEGEQNKNAELVRMLNRYQRAEKKKIKAAA